MADEKKSVYEIRLNGETVCTSSMPRLGYTPKRLREMLAAGYKYCADGKIQRKVE